MQLNMSLCKATVIRPPQGTPISTPGIWRFRSSVDTPIGLWRGLTTINDCQSRSYSNRDQRIYVLSKAWTLRQSSPMFAQLELLNLAIYITPSNEFSLPILIIILFHIHLKSVQWVFFFHSPKSFSCSPFIFFH